VVLVIMLAAYAAGAWLFILGMNQRDLTWVVAGVALFVVASFIPGGFQAVQPNDSRVLTFFGSYAGSLRQSGFWWVNPFTIKHRVSLRVRNFNSDTLKVNDADGNPVEIGAVVVWRVQDSAKATFDVDDYEEFVDIQSETALRSLATRYPYDAAGKDRPSLRENPDDLASSLKTELDARLDIAGVDVMEARLTHLAYAPEIAQAMLRRQQAQAVVSARKLIVEAAVGMVEDAIMGLAASGVVDLDPDKRAAMANNLMVSLTSDSGVSPVVNTGTLYSG
jgi:regulator of protease activity HflC (stomatin/prohibitin superfamily)